MSGLSYGDEKTLENETFDGAVRKVTEALRTEGLGVLTEIDVRQTLKKKLDALVPGAMAMGSDGMAEHARHQEHMVFLPNTFP